MLVIGHLSWLAYRSICFESQRLLVGAVWSTVLISLSQSTYLCLRLKLLTNGRNGLSFAHRDPQICGCCAHSHTHDEFTVRLRIVGCSDILSLILSLGEIILFHNNCRLDDQPLRNPVLVASIIVDPAPKLASRTGAILSIKQSLCGCNVAILQRFCRSLETSPHLNVTSNARVPPISALFLQPLTCPCLTSGV